MSNDVVEIIKSAATAISVFGAFLLFGVCLLITVARIIEEHKLDSKTKKALALLTIAFTFYGGAKHGAVPNAGADAGIALVSVATEYDGTNDVTSVEVRFTGQGVTTATPVSVRNDQTELWRELEKIGAEVTTDLATNVLSFGVSGNVGTNRYWWVGTETPAVIIETKGIKIVHFAASSSSVQIMWTCDDPNATEFAVQRRRKRTAAWETVGVTTSFAYVYVGFTVGETWEWRVSATYREGEP